MKQETLYIAQNSVYVRLLNVVDQDGDAVDISNADITMYISKFFGQTSAFEIDVQKENSLQGIIKISISAEGTKMLPAGAMVYSIFVTPNNGDSTLILQGQAIVQPTVH
jgi:hypothetical protein